MPWMMKSCNTRTLPRSTCRVIVHPCRAHSGNGTPTTRSASVPSKRTVRKQKNPKEFASLDELREHLEEGEGTKTVGFITGALNWFSGSAFGSGPSDQPWWSPARLYRWLATGLNPPRRRWVGDDEEGDETARITAAHKRLEPVLLLPRHAIKAMVFRYPPVLDADPRDVISRVLLLRELVPGCDAVLLLEKHPQLFFRGTVPELRAHIAGAMSKLQGALKGAPITPMVMSDPDILFMDLDHGLSELRSLWSEEEVDEHALANSEPHELAFAVRSLAATSPRALHEITLGSGEFGGGGLPGSGPVGVVKHGHGGEGSNDGGGEGAVGSDRQ